MSTLPLVAAAAALGVVTYYLTTLVQTVFHRWFGHHRRLDAVYENHANGHHLDYPARRLTTNTWIAAERHVMWYYALPLVPVAALAAWLLPWPLFAIHAATVGLTIWWHLHLHQHYHLNVTPWLRFAWFRQKRDLHLRHHLSHHRNYAIVEFFWDRLFGSYDARPPLARVTVAPVVAGCCGRAPLNAVLSPALLPGVSSGSAGQQNSRGLHSPPSRAAPGSVLITMETPQHAAGNVLEFNDCDCGRRCRRRARPDIRPPVSSPGRPASPRSC